MTDREPDRALHESSSMPWSADAYRQMFEQAAAAMFKAGLDGAPILVNREWAELFGFSSPEEVYAVQGPLADLLAEPGLAEELTRRGPSRPDHRVDEFLCRRRDGSTFVGRSRVRVLRDEHGAPRGFEGTIEDISAERAADEALRLANERLRAILDFAPACIVLADLDGFPVEINPGAVRFLGYEREELAGRAFTCCTHPDDAPREAALYARLRAGEIDSFRMDKRFIRKDGRVVWGHLTCTLIRDANGRPRNVLLVNDDITERKQMESALRDSEAHYHSLVDALPEGVCEVDLDGRLLYVSRRMAELYRVSMLQEVLGHSALRWVAPESRDKALRNLADGARGVEPADGEYVLLRDDGTRFIGEITGLLLPGTDGRPPSMVTIHRDISARKKAEEELQRHARGLEALYQSSLETFGERRELPDLLQSIVQRAAGLLGVSGGGVSMPTPDGTRLVVIQSWNTGRDCTGCTAAMGEGLSGIVAETGRTVAIEDYPAWEGRRPARVADGVKRAIAVPLKVGDETLGVLHMEDTERAGPFDETDIRLAQLFADQAALAIRNARLLENLERELARRRQAEQETQRIQAQLLQSQKMEAVGTLAGGVAHDFNNLLTAITGYAQFAARAVPPDSPPSLAEDIESVLQAARRATDLTRQLLAFSRRQVLQPQTVNLDDLLPNLDRMLRRLIGEHIELTTRTQSALRPVRADPGQIEQVLINLAVNARDAMPDGGLLTLETANVQLDGEAARLLELSPGAYVAVSVTDTGLGMTDEVQAHLFEPFFTTKEVGKGTGLGLATVYGIVKQHRGAISVISRPGEGSTFRVYLPALPERDIENGSGARRPELSFAGTETVLLVEDDPLVGEVARRHLADRGYTVLQARNGYEALQLAGLYPDPIHLLVTDVVMPLMGGKALAERLALIRPDTRVLYLSGYADRAIVPDGGLDPDVSVLQKPADGQELARKVRAVLDGGR